MLTFEHTIQVLVIGGSSGIGFAIAKLFHLQGATVTLAGRSAARLRQAAQDIGSDITIEPLDVMQPAELERFFARPTRWHHIIVTAASLTFGPLKTVSWKTPGASSTASSGRLITLPVSHSLTNAAL
jgi:NADP-dependent 3-hydroxy acid dehydrogenase YdfG